MIIIVTFGRNEPTFKDVGQIIENEYFFVMRSKSIFIISLLALMCLVGSVSANSIFSLNPDNGSLKLRNFDNDKYTSFDATNKNVKRRKPVDAYSKGKLFFAAGYGTPNMTGMVLSFLDGFSGFETSDFGPIHLKTEYGVSNYISLGLSINMASASATWYDEYRVPLIDTITTLAKFDEGVRNWSVAFNFRMNVHWYVTRKVDFYTGIGVGYNLSRFEFWSDSEDFKMPKIPSLFPPIGIESGIGLRYFFNNNVGIYMEAGYAKSLAQFGLILKV